MSILSAIAPSPRGRRTDLPVPQQPPPTKQRPRELEQVLKEFRTNEPLRNAEAHLASAHAALIRAEAEQRAATAELDEARRISLPQRILRKHAAESRLVEAEAAVERAQLDQATAKIAADEARATARKAVEPGYAQIFERAVQALHAALTDAVARNEELTVILETGDALFGSPDARANRGSPNLGWAELSVGPNGRLEAWRRFVESQTPIKLT